MQADSVILNPIASPLDTLQDWENYKTCLRFAGNCSRLVCFTLCLASVYRHDLNVEIPSVQALASRDRSSFRND